MLSKRGEPITSTDKRKVKNEKERGNSLELLIDWIQTKRSACNPIGGRSLSSLSEIKYDIVIPRHTHVLQYIKNNNIHRQSAFESVFHYHAHQIK